MTPRQGRHFGEIDCGRKPGGVEEVAEASILSRSTSGRGALRSA